MIEACSSRILQVKNKDSDILDFAKFECIMWTENQIQIS